MKKFLVTMMLIIAGASCMLAQQIYTTSKQTTVTTEKYNSNKIVALQWGNLRIESHEAYLQVYRYKNSAWVADQYIPRDTPKTYRFEKTYVADEFILGRFVTHTIVVTVLGAREGVGVSVTFNGSVKEAFTLKP